MIQQLFSNWVCWAIILTALVCYQQLWAEYFDSRDNICDNGKSDGGEDIRQNFSGLLIGVMPLLGLLGTIIGLLDCFAAIAREGADSTMLSDGIADALLTTQLGLICAIPGWLLQGYVKGCVKGKAKSYIRSPMPSSSADSLTR